MKNNKKIVTMLVLLLTLFFVALFYNKFKIKSQVINTKFSNANCLELDFKNKDNIILDKNNQISDKKALNSDGYIVSIKNICKQRQYFEIILETIDVEDKISDTKIKYSINDSESKSLGETDLAGHTMNEKSLHGYVLDIVKIKSNEEKEFNIKTWINKKSKLDGNKFEGKIIVKISQRK